MTSARSCGAAAAVALVLGTFGVEKASGQNQEPTKVYLSESVDAKQKMQQLDGYIALKNWAEAVDLLQTFAEKQGDRLAPTTSEDPSLFINLRTYCNARIAALPPEALAAYRARVDGQAEALWKTWEQTRDPRALQKIAEEFFCSTVADKAIDRLGDRAFAEGRLVDAAGWWTKLLPREWTVQVGDEPPTLQFRVPTPRIDPARIAAKCILATALAGDVLEGKRLFALLQARHPNAKGRLAGVEGLYTEILAKLFTAPELAPPKSDEDFPTFGGDERRNKGSATSADVGGLQHLWDFDSDSGNDRDDSPIGDLRLPHFPVAVGDAVYATTDSAVWKFDLKTGKAARWLDFGGGRNGTELARAKHTLTIKGSRLYVTVHDQRGTQERRLRPFGPRRDWHNVGSTLICFDLTTQKELWRATPADFGADRGAVFEGSPIGVGDDLCVAVTRYDAMSETSVLKIDVSGRRLIWKAVVCESMAETGVAEPPMYNLLSLGDSTIYYCTNLGAVAAIRADDGRLQWVATYTRRPAATTAPGDPSVPDLNPCVVHQGRVYALPRDGRRLLCLDAQTGQRRWESPAGLALSHVLGAQDGVVIATGSRVCAFDAATGKVRWMRPTNSTPGFGRGLIAGGDVYWPTRTEIHVFDVKTGEIARPPIELFTRLGHRPGNLLHAGDYLLVAQSHRLLAFCSFSKLIERHRIEITANPDAPEPRFQLGEALMQRGEFGPAADAFAEAADRAGPLRVREGRRLKDVALDRRFDALLAQADKSSAAEARGAFHRAVDGARTAVQQTAALTKEFARANLERQVQICQALLDSAAARRVLLPEGTNPGETAGAWAVRNLRALIEKHGRTVYSQQEAEFSKLLSSAKDSASLRELAERFPLAFTLSKSLEARARTALNEGEPAAAERIGRDWLVSARIAADAPSVQNALAVLVECETALKRPEAAYLYAASLSRTRRRDWPTTPAVDRVEFDARPGTTPFSMSMNAAAAQAENHPRFDIQVTARGESSILQWKPETAKGGAAVVTSVAGAISWVGRVAGGLAVAAGDDLLFLEPADPKKPAWRKRIREAQRFRLVSEAPGARPPVVSTSPDRFLVAGDLIVVSGPDAVFALGASDGVLRWRVPLGNASEQPPSATLVGAMLLVELESETMALDPVDGRKVLTLPGRIASAAAVDDVIAVASRAGVVGYDQRTGAERWKVTLASTATREPFLAAGRTLFFVVADGAQLLALSPREGAVKWRTPLAAGPAVDVAAVAARDVVAVAASGMIECWDASSGERRWKRRLDTDDLLLGGGHSLWIAGDRLAALQRGSQRERMFALASGEPLSP